MYKAIVSYLSVLLLIPLISCTANDQKVPERNDIQKLSSEVPLNEGQEVNEKLQTVVILFKDKKNRPIIEELGGEVLEDTASVPMIKAKLSDNAIQALQHHKEILSIERDKKIETNIQSSSWGIHDINAQKAWNQTLTGKGVDVAILDSGVDRHHPDLKIAGGKSFVSYSSSFDDDSGHGTHVAGIIAAQNNDIGTVGVAPGVNLYAVKVLDELGEGYLFDIIAGIDWCIVNNIEIVNMSIGTPLESPALKAVIEKANKKGMLLVAAAGNTGGAIDYPAQYDEVIAVGAVDQKHLPATFSAKGNALEFVAPGVNIVSTFLHNDYYEMDGTSMASPYIAGLFALMKEASREEPFSVIRKNLQAYALDLGAKGRDKQFGFGFLRFTEGMQYTDIRNNWAQNDIIQMLQLGWMIGTSSSTFSPNKALTREQAAVIITRVFNLKPIKNGTTTFTDVPATYWAKQEIGIASQHGLVKGTGNGSFSPKKNITREEMATILSRALGMAPTQSTTSLFHDISPTRWSHGHISTLTSKGIISGFQDKTFRPKENVTRAQMASMLARMNALYHIKTTS